MSGTPVLTIDGGPDDGRTVAIGKATTTLGRGPNSDIVLEWSGVSRSHAQILRHGGYHLYDLGSTNGTFVNGTTVGPAGHLLQHGDQIQLGTSDASLVFQSEVSETVATRAQRNGGGPTTPAVDTSAMTQPIKAAGAADSVLQYLKDHPEGADWDAIQAVAGLSEVELLRTLGILLDAGKVQRRSTKFFAEASP